MKYPSTRPRRLRLTSSIREMVAETSLRPSDLILPVFVHEGSSNEPIKSMPGVDRLSLRGLAGTADRALKTGIRTMTVFPVVPDRLKSRQAAEAFNQNGLVSRAVKMLRDRYPELTIITDVALDPYTSHGHDGLMSSSGEILNDETVAVLVRQAICLAEAGSHVVAPSDMMDGRVRAIRDGLDQEGFKDTLILSYAAKYASAFYGPFRDAVGSVASLGKSDKKTYQMDPRNLIEAVKEVQLDVDEGADIVMVKPGLPYLDVISLIKRKFNVPVFAYQVSGEYAMIKAGIERGWLDGKRIPLETIICLRRAGADCVLTYFALELARQLLP